MTPQQPEQPIVIDDVKRIVYKPGDAILFRFAQPISAETAHRVTEQAQAALPDARIMIVGPGVEVEVAAKRPTPPRLTGVAAYLAGELA